MRFKVDTKEQLWWWFDVIHFKIPAIIGKLQTIKYFASILYNPPPKFRRKESIRNWLKRIPSKYAERYAKYIYDEARRSYITIQKRQLTYDMNKLTNAQKKELKEILNLARDLLTNAEEQYKEVLIRKKLASI